MCLQHGTVPAPGSSEGHSNFELGFLSGMVNAKNKTPQCIHNFCKLLIMFRFEENSFDLHSFDETVTLWLSPLGSFFQNWSVEAYTCSLVVCGVCRVCVEYIYRSSVTPVLRTLRCRLVVTRFLLESLEANYVFLFMSFRLGV